MTHEEAKKVEEYFDAGYAIIVNTGMVDFPISYMEEVDGEVLFTSEVYDEAPLTDVYIDQLIIAKPIKKLEDGYIEPVGDFGEYYMDGVL